MAKDAETQLKLVQRGSNTLLKNPTPYYIAIVNVKHAGKDVSLSNNVMNEVSQLKPYSEVNLGKRLVGKSVWMP